MKIHTCYLEGCDQPWGKGIIGFCTEEHHKQYNFGKFSKNGETPTSNGAKQFVMQNFQHMSGKKLSEMLNRYFKKYYFSSPQISLIEGEKE